MFEDVALKVTFCLVGMVIGSFAGIFIMALCNMASQGGEYDDIYWHTGDN